MIQADHQNNRVLFITYDLSGYYNCIHEELKNRFKEVDYFNTIDKYKYKNIFQRLYSLYFKTFTNKKIKNYYKLQPIIEQTDKKYDYIIIIRPDMFFESQLKVLRARTPNFIAYYHDSINNIPRKKDLIPFFDKVYSYEKVDVKNYNLLFLSNFIYLDKDKNNTKEKTTKNSTGAFTIMAYDYRVQILKTLGHFFKENNYPYTFLIHSNKDRNDEFITIIKDRKNNNEVLTYLNSADILVDIHKYNIQDGLTFRIFESLFFEKKLITTSEDIKTYDFYNPNNIHVISENSKTLNIPKSFFTTPYEKLPNHIYNKYHYKTWLNTLLTV